MTYNTVAQESGSDRVILSLFAAGIMFVAGYTAVRVTMAQSTSFDPSVQVNVIPHEATLWANDSSAF
ncbi:MAG: hypothetical protein F6K16_33135 [Symploca sp. SIO2B6]|nr:hypothetical protein [Symploca sp. SIO2B6]